MENYIKSKLENYQKLGELQSFVLSIMVSCLTPGLTAREALVQLADLGHDVENDEDNTLRSLLENELSCKSVLGGCNEEERLFACADALISTAGLIGELAEKAYIRMFLEEWKNK